MKFMLDTANLAEIKEFAEILPLAGVTSNPSIVKKEGEIDFFKYMREIRSIIGTDKSLHIQVVATDFDGIMADAAAILDNIDEGVYIKVPVTQVGLKAIKALKAQGRNVTATAIYTKFQAYLAIEAGADYIAPYFNRMENLNIDAKAAVTEMAKEIQRTASQTEILAASFKNVAQVNTALECGAQAATMSVDIIKQAFAMPSIEQAVRDFTKDWESIFDEGVTIADLAKDKAAIH